MERLTNLPLHYAMLYSNDLLYYIILFYTKHWAKVRLGKGKGTFEGGRPLVGRPLNSIARHSIVWHSAAQCSIKARLVAL